MVKDKTVTVQFVADELLCNGCATCVSVCPVDCISIYESPTGLLQAEVDHEKCILCGACTKVCSATHVLPELIRSGADPFSGRPLSGFCGYARSRTVKENGKSGGIATALVSYLLDSGIVNKALLTAQQENPLRHGPVVFKSGADLSPAQSSWYGPVGLNSVLKDIDDTGNLVYVGLSCQIRGLHNYLAHKKKGKEKPFIIGLFCDSVLSYKTIDHLISGTKIQAKEISRFRYIDKRYGSFPGNCVIETKEGETVEVPNSKRVFVKRFLKPPYCFLCHDKLNMYSDISLGDTWGLDKSRQGQTAAVCWTQRGEELLKDAGKKGYIELGPADLNKIEKGQDIATRRATWNTSVSIWKERGRYVPDYGPPIPATNHKVKTNHKAAKRFERSVRLFSSGTSKEFDRKFRHMRLLEFLPFKLKEMIAYATGIVLKRKDRV